MVVGAYQSFQFFQTKTWFLKNNGALFKYYLISIIKLLKKSVHKTELYINYASHLK